MPTVTIPLTAYSIRKAKPNNPYGAPAAMPVRDNEARVLLRGTLDKVPLDGDISVAKLRVWSDRARAASSPLEVRPVNDGWKARVKWSNQPTVGALIQTLSPNPIGARHLYEFDVTAWAQTRSRRGLRLDTTLLTNLWLSGSTAPNDKPVLVVTYTVPPEVPANLVPDGNDAVVSDPDPILTYAGDDGMTLQQVRFSNDEGLNVSYTSAWLPAITGRYNPVDDPGANPVMADGQQVWWSVRTDGDGGISEWSEWAEYIYRPLVFPVITSPGAETLDGSPTLTWTIANQTAYKVDFYHGSDLVATSGWSSNTATRSWTPPKSIPVPGATGRFVLTVRDQYNRVAAAGAPAYAEVTHTFTTSLTGANTAIDNLDVTFEDPIPVLTGTVDAGLVPAEVALFRDGVQVPIWDADGNAFMWAPKAEFFTGQNFVIRDYTSPPRGEHTWQVWVRGAGLPEITGPPVTKKFVTRSVWLVDPRSGDQIEILGYGDAPVIEQATEETGVVHVPINGGLNVETKRRRLVRATRNGEIEGTVLNEDEDTLNEWVQADSGLKYRLIFGKVNWSVIIGDYSPSDLVGYPGACGPDRVLVNLDWWQRVADY